MVTSPGVLLNDGDANSLPLTAELSVGPTKGILTLNPNGSFTYTPNTNSNGSDSFTYRARNTVPLNSNIATVSLTVTPVNDPPVAVNDGSGGSPFLTIAEDSGQSNSMTVLANDSDMDGDALTITQASSPNGSVVTSFTDTRLRFTPALNFSGSTAIFYTISDGKGGTASATVHVRVTPVNDAPVAVNDGSIGSPFLTIAEDSGQSNSMAVLANDSDVDGDSLTITQASSPNGSVVTSFTNTRLRFTPAANFNGSTTISYTISDGNGGTASATVHVLVTPANDAPVALAQSVTTDEDTALPITLTGSDIDGDTLTTFNVTAQPLNGTLTGSGANRTYTPNANYHGVDSFSFKVSDASLQSLAAATVSIIVNPVNDAPVAIAQSVAAEEDTALPITLSGSDIDGDTLTNFNVTAQPEFGTLTGSGANRTYTPNENYHGPDSFSFTVSDGSLTSAPATVSITVNPINDAPVALVQSLSTDEDTALPITLTGNDIDGDTLTNFNVTMQPQFGTLTGSGANRTYTPNENYHGPDSLSFTVSDGSLTSAPATVSITVNPINDPPAAIAENYSIDEDNTLTVPAAGVLANDTDLEGTALTAILVDDATRGTLTLAPDGGFIYTPDSNFNGEDAFTYKATDGTLESNIATVSITVNPVNDAPVALAQAASTDEDTALPITLTGSDIDGDTLAIFNVTVQPQFGTLTGSGANRTYTPDANYTGPDSFSFTVSDGSLISVIAATVSVTVNPVNDAPVAIAQSVATEEDTALPITLTGSDIDGDTLTIFNVTVQPQFGTLTGSGANRTYTPDANYTGPDSFSFTVSDASLTSVIAATVSVTVNPVNDAPVALAQSVTTEEDTALPITLTGSDIDGDTLTIFNVTVQPLNGILTGTGANQTYTPNANYHGNDSFSFTVSDASLQSITTATVSITVSPINDAPVALAQSVATDEDTALPITLTGSDIDGDTLTSFHVTAQPLNGTLTGSGANQIYTPNANFHGNDSFSFTVSDASLTSAPTSVSITVNPVNDTPVAVAENYSSDEDNTLTVPAAGVLANDTDLEGTALTAILVDDVTHGTLALAPHGGFIYTPDPNFNGEDSFTYKATDGTLESSIATVSITVNSVNDAPIALAQSASTDEDTALPITLNGNDIDGDTLTTFNVTVQPQFGTLTGSGANRTYAPNENYHGPDSFSFTVSDGSLTSAPATVSITVTSVNDPPVAIAENYSIDEDTTLTVPAAGVLANDTDLEGAALTAILVDDATRGTLTLAPDGGFIYTPDANFNGEDSFTYKAPDGTLESNIATVSITVNSVNDAPVALAQSASTDEDTALPITLTGNDIDGDTLTNFNVTVQPQFGSLTGSGANRTYTPNENYHGPDSFSFMVSDGSLTSAPASVSITVNPINDAPVALVQSASTDEDTALPITLTGNDIDGDTLTTFNVTIQPQFGTLTGSGANRTYTPNENYHGPDSFSFTVSDGSLTSAPATVSITVNPINDPPAAIAENYSIDEDNTLTVPAAGVLANDTDLEGTALTAILVDDATRGTLTLAPDGGFIYTPDANFNGEDSFTYKATDGTLESNVATVSITVSPVNDPPVAIGQSLSTDEDTPLPITLAGSDIDGDTLTTFNVTVQPQFGTLTGSGANRTYTPNENYHGPDSFSFTVSDGSLTSGPASISITVNPVNDPPLAVDDGSIGAPFLTVAEDSGLSETLSVLTNDSDVDGHALTITTASSANGEVSIVGNDMQLRFTPAHNFNGAATISYSISDGNGGTASATVHLLVTAANDAPIATPDSYTTDEDTPLIVSSPGVLENDSDQENSTLSATLILSVAHGTLDLGSGGGFTYTPEANFNGVDSFTYQTSDGELTSNEVTVTITVNPVNDIPVAFSGSTSVDEDNQVSTTLTAIDVEGTPLTFAISTQPTHGSVTLSGAVATYTPLPDFHGTDSFTFTVSDGVSTSVPATVSVIVNPMDEFTQWLERGSIVGGPNDDPDGDSFSNALEFVLGGNPGEASDGGILPTATLTSADLNAIPGEEEYLQFSYRRSHRSMIDPTTAVIVEWATTLTGPWSSANGTHGEQVLTEPGDSSDQVKVYIPRSLEADGLLFTRLKVVINLPPNSTPPPDE